MRYCTKFNARCSAVILWLMVLICTPAVAQSDSLARLAGATSEIFNSIIDTFVRRPLSQSSFGWTAADTTSVFRSQRLVPRAQPFMCRTRGSRSDTTPTSVHALRPGDISVVAAMGDSLIAGNGPKAHDLARLILNHRGLSWAIGGQGDWRRYLTLPNLLKQFNPQLTGFSTGDGYSYSRSAGLNVAVTGAITPDLPHQARVLVKRMRSDPRVDMENHWKLVTVMIGSNDLCIYSCYEPTKYSAAAHLARLRESLDYLYAHVPRLFVNLVLQPDLSALRAIPDPSLLCDLTHKIECPCMFGAYANAKAAFVDSLVLEYQRVEKELVASGRYDERPDFTVVLQPFTENPMTGDKQKGCSEMETDLFAVDCFHLSQKGNAYGANALWNNMLEPLYNKSTSWQPEFQRVLCPTKETPFLFTKNNSETFLRIGRQIEIHRQDNEVH